MVAALFVIEASARLAEPWLTPPPPSTPSPAPGPLPPDYEARLRAARMDMPVLPMVANETQGWSLPPHEVRRMGPLTIRINAEGLRGPEIVPPVEGERRLLTLGDSSIFGLGVSEPYVFSTVAAAALSKAWGRPVTPYIGGVPGYDSGQSRSQLDLVGPKLDPDWVVIGNLWSDLYRIDRFEPRGDERLEAPRELATWRVLRLVLAPWLASRKVGWAEGPERVGELGVGDGRAPRVSLADYERNLAAMAARARELGARPVFLMLPAPIDLDPASTPATVTAYRRAMREVADREGAPLLDGPALFVAKGVSLAWWTDQVHPSPEGHVLLGEALAELLAPLGP